LPQPSENVDNIKNSSSISEQRAQLNLSIKTANFQLQDAEEAIHLFENSRWLRFVCYSQIVFVYLLQRAGIAGLCLVLLSLAWSAIFHEQLPFFAMTEQAILVPIFGAIAIMTVAEACVVAICLRKSSPVLLTNLRVVKLQTSSETFTIGKDSTFSVAPAIGGGGIVTLSEVGGMGNFSFCSSSLKNDMALFPQHLVAQTNILKDYVSKEFLSNNSEERRRELLAPLLCEDEIVLAIGTTNLAAYKIVIYLLAGILMFGVVGLALMGALQSFPMLITVIGAPISVLIYALLNRNRPIVFTNKRILKVQPSGALQLICPFGGSGSIEQTGDSFLLGSSGHIVSFKMPDDGATAIKHELSQPGKHTLKFVDAKKGGLRPE
jgi:hypothetical protein